MKSYARSIEKIQARTEISQTLTELSPEKHNDESFLPENLWPNYWSELGDFGL